jgi:ketosteroid isomerase-like protein
MGLPKSLAVPLFNPRAIDRRATPGILSVTFMFDGAIMLSVPPCPKRHWAVTRAFLAALFLAFGLAAACAGQPKQPHKHEARHEIDQLEEQWRTAMLKGDTNALGSLLADDYVAISASGTLQNKSEALASMSAHRIRFTALDISDRKVRFYGSTALVNSLAQVQGVNPEGEMAGSYRYTRVYVHDAQGHWKIVSFEINRVRRPGQLHPLDSGAAGK